MKLEEALTAHLQAVLIGVIGDRVFPLELPQRPVLPAIVYRKISGDQEYSQDGPSTRHPVYQLEAYAKTCAAAVALADQIRLELDGFKGRMPPKPEGVLVDACFHLDDDQNFYDEDEQIKVHWVAAQYEIWFLED